MGEHSQQRGDTIIRKNWLIKAFLNEIKVEHFHAYDLVMFLFVLINQGKYYAQDSILGRLIKLQKNESGNLQYLE